MKKLTLSADEKVIAQAKRLAARQRTSVSAMFARFVTTTSRRENAPLEVPPDSIAARVAGVIRLPRGKSERDVLTEALMAKHRIKP
jgi:ribosomal protein S19E (S16A)